LTGAVLLTAAAYGLSRYNNFIAFAITYPGGFAPIFAVMIFCCARYRKPSATRRTIKRSYSRR